MLPHYEDSQDEDLNDDQNKQQTEKDLFNLVSI